MRRRSGPLTRRLPDNNARVSVWMATGAISLVLNLGWISLALPQGLLQPIGIDPSSPGIPNDVSIIGSGWDSELQTDRNKCVQRRKSTAIPRLQRVLSGTARLNTFSSASAVIEAATTTIAASYNGTGSSASASYSEARSGHFSSYKSFAAFEARFFYPVQGLNYSDFELSPLSKRQLLSARGVAAFREICGDQFVAGVIRGGSMSIRLDVLSRTQELQSSAQASLQAAYGSYSGSAEQFAKLQSITSEHSVEIVSHGLPELSPQPPHDVATAMDIWLKYQNRLSAVVDPPIVALQPYPYDALITAFYLSRKQNKTATVTPVWVHNVAAEFGYIRQLMLLKADIVYIIGHSSEFVHHDLDQLNRGLSIVDNLIQVSSTWANDCIRTSGSGCEARPSIVQLPARPNRISQDWKIIMVVGGTNGRVPSVVSTLIGSTYERTGLVELKGRWRYATAPDRFFDVNNCGSCALRIVSRNNSFPTIIERANQPGQSIPSLRIVPPNADVYYDFADEYWNDNAQMPDPNERAQGRVGDVLDLSPILQKP